MRELAPSPVARARLTFVLFRGFLEPYFGFLRDGRLLHIQVPVGGQPHNLALRANGADVFTFYEVFLKGVYDACLPLRAGATVLDLGANVGMASVYFKYRRPDAHIVAVEPASANFAILASNVEGMGIKTLRAAVAAQSGTGQLAVSGGPTGYSLQETEHSDSPVERIRLVAMDELAHLTKASAVDVLKADIEGAETQVFRHRSRLLDATAVVLVELHGEEARNTVIPRLTDQGFRHVTPDEPGFPDIFIRPPSSAK
jgi:FkbM family methyltransferase